MRHSSLWLICIFVSHLARYKDTPLTVQHLFVWHRSCARQGQSRSLLHISLPARIECNHRITQLQWIDPTGLEGVPIGGCALLADDCMRC